jgi:pimeloyl-ACP methyl ester carboxylesterase
MIKTLAFIFGCVLVCRFATAQEVNNLVLPPGTVVAKAGELGRVQKIGSGPIKVILIADAGFSGEIYDELMQRNKTRCTFYAVTLPGSDNTKPPPMPSEGTSYSKLTWLTDAQQGILNLIEKEKMIKPVIAGNLIIATSIVLNLAIQHPDKVQKVIILGGMPRATWPSQKGGQVLPEERAFAIDNYTAPKMYKTMTLDTWKKNLYQAIQFSKDSARGTRYFRLASDASIPIMTRYLCEFYTTDVAEQYQKMAVPTLVLLPGFDEKYLRENPRFMDKEYLWDGWAKARANPNFQFETIPGARLFVWMDQPEDVDAAINQFLDR